MSAPTLYDLNKRLREMETYLDDHREVDVKDFYWSWRSAALRPEETGYSVKTHDEQVVDRALLGILSYGELDQAAISGPDLSREQVMEYLRSIQISEGVMLVTYGENWRDLLEVIDRSIRIDQESLTQILSGYVAADAAFGVYLPETDGLPEKSSAITCAEFALLNRVAGSDESFLRYLVATDILDRWVLPVALAHLVSTGVEDEEAQTVLQPWVSVFSRA